jgi:heme A synthase
MAVVVTLNYLFELSRADVFQIHECTVLAMSTLQKNKVLAFTALTSAVVVYSLIIFGSHVRVTESGMGCPDWPLCKGSIGLTPGFHAFMEQTHRYIAAIVTVLVSLTAFLALRFKTMPAAIRPAIFTGATVILQVILGAITVFSSNGAPTVAAHLLAGLALLAGATFTAIATIVPQVVTPVPRISNLAWLALAGAALLYLSGSLIVNAEAEKSCASFPLCPSNQPTKFVALHLIHRGMVVLATTALIIFATHAWRKWSRHRGARVLSGTLIGLICTTAILGILSALKKAPADLQDLHLAGAAAVLSTSVALVGLGWLAGADSPSNI